ncbi:mechanosensitive ion channel family protein [Ancylobacter radicis]|uniref:Mechanosensitive ion channel family protein n=1 Tax=Ancylobacter radicis TaxID=2836179 RepID=A0ABS5RB65_9HYPH|nr:mechanosensitive ion channel family protein [Ancylobacter radicis]MBS9478896.1 mechanosensitive ion channel family protein [Ancylobacter radicis]
MSVLVRFRLLPTVLALSLLTAMSLPARAQTAAPAESAIPTTAPLPISPQQFDQLVDALSKAVAERLKAEQVAAPAGTTTPATAAAPASPPAAPPMMDMEMEEPLSEVFIEVVERGDDALEHFPALIQQAVRIPMILGPDLNSGRDPNRFLLLLAACVAAALATEGLLRLALRWPRRYLASRVEGAASIWALAALIGLDVVVLTGMWLVTHGFVVGLFAGSEPQARFGYLVLTSVFYWRLYLLIFRIPLRPKLAPARLADIGDDDARRIYRWASAVILIAIVLADIRRILEGMQSPPLVVACAMLINTMILTSVLIAASVHIREPVAKWLHGLTQSGRPGALAGLAARWWLAVAIPFFLALGMARVYGALTSLEGIHLAILMTLDVLIALIVIESFMDKVCRLMRSETASGGKPESRERLVEAIMRCVRVAVLLGAMSLTIRIWLVYGIGMMDNSRYNAIAGAALPAGAILLGAYCAWQAVIYVTGKHAGKRSTTMPGLDAEDGNEGPASRMSTLMPLLRVTLLLAIIILAGLTMLGQLGIDVVPLIAGASIIGLAISFGSQTLVKDIVSGVFYLVDDAFRVGEYIDCGKATGTVEGFTLRSLKLRHQNGQIHTIPFGQLGQVTNFSRDWTTMKFNLRFARNTDLEKLRKTVKRIGLEMLEDPELKEEFLMPLKMQGVADIDDTALIVRFKFTVRPVKPTVVRREAIKRMIFQLPEQGIEFANNTVAVQSLAAPEHGGAAAAVATARARAANDLLQQAEAEAAAS